MKGFLVLVALSAFLVFVKGEDIKEKLTKSFEKCKEKHPVKEEEIEKMKQKNIDYAYSQDAKCLMACMMEEGKVLQDGKYNKENALVMADVIHKDKPEHAAKAKEVVETCAKQHHEVGSDKCEFAYLMTLCAAKEGKKAGVDSLDIFM